MLFAVTGLLGCAVEASDGRVGAVKDFLFVARSWKIRWMAVDAGHWLSGRRILIHPSAIDPLDLARPASGRLPMMSGAETPVVSVHVTKRQIETGPDAREHEPVTQRLQARLHDHYGWDPYRGDTFFGFDAIDPISKPILAETTETQSVPRPTREPIPTRAIRTWAAWSTSTAITFTRRMAISATSRISSPTTSTGTSATSSSPRTIGGRASMSGSRPMPSKTSTGPSAASTSMSRAIE